MEVSGGHASEIGTITASSSCQIASTELKALPSSVEDSTQVASELLGLAPVESFLQSYASANADYALLNLGTEGSVWTVTYSGCPISGYGSGVATGATVSAELNASTGELLGNVASSPSSTACPGSSQSQPIGTAFAAGNPIATRCYGTSLTFAMNGCKGGDYVYNLTIETAGATFANVLWEVKTASGGIYVLAGPGGFSIINIAGIVVAQSVNFAAGDGMAMTASFSTFSASATACNGAPCSSSTPFSSIYTIEIDMGTANPAGQGLSFVTVGTDGYSGTTSLALP